MEPEGKGRADRLGIAVVRLEDFMAAGIMKVGGGGKPITNRSLLVSPFVYLERSG